MTKLAENNPQGTANIADDRMLATATLSGCEIVKCQHYKDGKCNDPNEYVNKQGENVCGRREDAILYELNENQNNLPTQEMINWYQKNTQYMDDWDELDRDVELDRVRQDFFDTFEDELKGVDMFDVWGKLF